MTPLIRALWALSNLTGQAAIWLINRQVRNLNRRLSND